ncbi:MAG TPA: DUF3072 domain-containing protein, partial [Flavitalea sp.]|nr:DUF3072 domain-containing protein [Flavitalea sp.]
MENNPRDEELKANDHPQHQQPNATNIAQSQPGSNTIKDPDQWTTGDERMTGAQRSYLKTLSDEAGEPFNEELTKAEASKR